jgi:hypothetical protein
MERKCSRCETVKSIDDFNFKNRKTGTYQSICKECCKLERRETYGKYKSKISAKNKRNAKKKNDWYREYKSKIKCERCGENHPACLEFHHLEPDKKDLEVSQLINTYSIERTISEIEKCIVLCSNCHKKLHYEEGR